MVATAEDMEAQTADQRSDEQHDSRNEDIDADHEIDDHGGAKPRKKRRIVKTSDKKYECSEPECDKKYSRAEHLYRHQLNHKPKNTFHCDIPGCTKWFVRADLYARHKERHNAKGSHLQRKDAFMTSQRADDTHNHNDNGNTNNATTNTNTTPGSMPALSSGPTTVGASPIETNHIYHQPLKSETYLSPQVQAQPFANPNDGYPSHHATAEMHHSNTETGMPLDPQLSNSHASAHNGFSHVNGNYPQPMIPPPAMNGPERRISFDSSFVARPSSAFNQTVAMSSMHPPPPLPSPSNPPHIYTGQPYPSPSSTNIRSPIGFSSLPPLPPFGYQPGYGQPGSARSGSLMSPPSISSADQHPMPPSRANSVTDFNAIDQSISGFSMPVFGSDIGFSRSPPLALSDDFLAMLFGSSAMMPEQPNLSPPGPEPMHNPQLFNMPLPKLEPDGTPSEPPQSTPEFPSPKMANGLDINMRESAVSEKCWLRLIDLVNRRFNESEHVPGKPSREEIMDGALTDPHHVFSLHMLKTYITSFWVHMHQQMPILHRPTFNPETCPDLLLIAMMCLGASCLERTHHKELTTRCAELASFLAYHVRWEVFKDPEFRPTAKLWTFQTMLLLELFEKMFSTRSLHERAHIHHATTLVVMRRGSSLIGRANDFPLTSNDPTRTPPGPENSINTSGQNTPDATWNRWITAEATRRAAFAAFIIDSTHATLFGHSAVMSPHDIKLPLPCDDPLWAATSSAEVQRVEASLAANGFKPTTFIDALKKTLNGQKVRTNTFGRVIIMAGLLNVSWHMNQRDLQVSSLGAGSTLGNQYKWRALLTRAFDHWRRDFDESLSKNEHWQQIKLSTDRSSIDYKDSVFESRTCLHSLAHMAMHVDMIDCTVFAGSERALGRIVTDQDRTAIEHRMKEWAHSARARDAVFYAIRFLREVLLPEEDLVSNNNKHQFFPSRSCPPAFTYSARDDYLLNRPWILYFAALIVWSYGYALDGPIRPSSYRLSAEDLQVSDMQRYLNRLGSVKSPNELEKERDRNSCVGLLILLKKCFMQPRWELCHEASDILGKCVDLLLPGHAFFRPE